MLSKTTALAPCVGCRDRTYFYSAKLSASVCGEKCEKRVSDRLHDELITVEEAQPQGQLQARKRPEVTQDKWRVSIS